VQKAIASDLNHRYAEGLPNQRFYPGTKYIDEIEIKAIDHMNRLFQADFTDLRPVSGTMANLVCYTAFTKPGDYLMSLGVSKGGHISIGSNTLGGTAGAVANLRVVRFAFDEEEFNIDVDETIRTWDGMVKADRQPKIVVFGGSVLLYPQPVKELCDHFYNNNNSRPVIIYDAAHVAGLIAGGQFQNPIADGVSFMTMSTHKTFPGPQHGAIVGKNWYELADRVRHAAFPGLTSNHHLGAVAGVGITAREMLKHGQEYAMMTIHNANALAERLHDNGLKVVFNEYQGFTRSHIVLLDVSNIFDNAREAQERLEKCGIMANANLLPWDTRHGRTAWNPTGLRIGVQECTRLGMNVGDMLDVAHLITEALRIPAIIPMLIRNSAEALMNKFKEVKYCD
jgi:glycine hydroxymethyltransferase